MRAGDLDRVVAIERALFPTPWRREHFAEELHERGASGGVDARLLRINEVVRGERSVVAYVCAWLLLDELRINNIAVAPEEQGHGIGRWFLRQLLARAVAAGARRVELEVRPSNARALALYRREGFREIGRRSNYYAAEGEDAIVMELDLTTWPVEESSGGNPR